MKKMSTLVLALLVATTTAGCATEDETEAAPGASCEGSSPGLGELSCLQNKPVDETGLAPDQRSAPLAVKQITEEEGGKGARTDTRGRPGIWYGCSRVSAEGWTYESCGSSHYVFMTFDGAYGNLIGYGIGYC